MFLGARLKFEEHLKVIITKVNKTIRLLWKWQQIFAETGINNHVPSLCETTSRLWQHNL